MTSVAIYIVHRDPPPEPPIMEPEPPRVVTIDAATAGDDREGVRNFARKPVRSIRLPGGSLRLVCWSGRGYRIHPVK